MQVKFEVEGTSPLLMHNPRMVDPEFEINREIKQITAKRKKTDDDNARVGMLEWFGGIYEIDGKVVQPVRKLLKSIIEAGRISKMGTTIERALILDGIDAPLLHDGPDTLEDMYADPRHRSRLSVGVNGKRVMRVRPQFPVWGLTITGTLIPDAGLNFDELQRIADLAGRAIGLGDARKIGYGRYRIVVTEVTA